MTGAIQKWGNSLALRIPSAVARQLQVENGDAVELKVESGTLTIRAAKPRYDLAELLKRMSPENRHEEVGWGEAQGHEV